MKRRIRLLAAALATAGLAAGLTTSATGTAFADVTPPSGTWSEIFNPYLHAQGITLCADDPGGSTRIGQLMQLWRCHGYASNGAPQRWVFLPFVNGNDIPIRDPSTGDILYQILNLAANECLTAGGPAPGQQMALTVCDTAEVWDLRSDNAVSQNGFDFQIALGGQVVGSDSTCVSASNFTDNNGTRLVTEPCSQYDTSQIWNLG